MDELSLGLKVLMDRRSPTGLIWPTPHALDELLEQARALEDGARAAFAAALGVHGLDELTVEPPQQLSQSLLRREQRGFLGTRLVEAELELADEGPVASRLRPTPEVRASAAAFRELIRQQAALAACAGNLRRLIDEYVRTERRARALEKVLIPEIDSSLRFIEEQLDALDQGEALRVRMAGRHAD